MAEYIRCHNCGSTFKVEGDQESEVRCRNCGVMLDRTPKGGATEQPVLDMIDLETPPEPAPQEQPHFVEPPQTPQKPPEPPGIFEGKTYWYNMVRFLIPFRGLGDFLTFLFIYALAYAMPFVSMMCCIGLITAFMIAGFLCSFCFNLVYASAEGEDKLPEPESFFEAINNFWSDIANPFFKFTGSFSYVYAPTVLAALICVQYNHPDTISESAWIHIVLWVLIGIGTFLWPMALLIFACEDWLCLVKPHWIFTSVIRILPAYITVCIVMSILAVGGYYMLIKLEMDIYHFDWKLLLFWLIVVYLTLYAMRLTGLLYRHYQQKIAMELK